MALPTTNLTLHLDAKDVDTVFTTANGGGSGVHTGVPSDGATFQVWDDEGDGVSNVAFFGNAAFAGGNDPKIRIASPLMLHPCVDFATADGDNLVSQIQAGNGGKALSNFISGSAWSVVIAIYPETIATTGGLTVSNDAIFGANGFFAMLVRDASGTKKVFVRSNDGLGNNVDIEGTIGTGDTWIVVARRDATHLKLTIIDSAGNEVSASNVAAAATSGLGNNLVIGRNTSSSTFDGRIGELAIYNAELTGTDLNDAKDYFKANWLAPAGGGGGVGGGLLDSALVGGRLIR